MYLRVGARSRFGRLDQESSAVTPSRQQLQRKTTNVPVIGNEWDMQGKGDFRTTSHSTPVYGQGIIAVTTEGALSTCGP